MALTDDKGRLYAHCFYFDEEVVSERRTESPVSASSAGPEGRAILYVLSYASVAFCTQTFAGDLSSSSMLITHSS